MAVGSKTCLASARQPCRPGLAARFRPASRQFRTSQSSQLQVNELCSNLVELFKTEASQDTRDFTVNVQNVILAFAGRVLLKQTKLQLEVGHRYALT